MIARNRSVVITGAITENGMRNNISVAVQYLASWLGGNGAAAARRAAALEGTEWADRPVEDVLKNLGQVPDDKRNAVRNNAGGHANHSLFWTITKPGGCT